MNKYKLYTFLTQLDIINFNSENIYCRDKYTFWKTKIPTFAKKGRIYNPKTNRLIKGITIDWEVALKGYFKVHTDTWISSELLSTNTTLLIPKIEELNDIRMEKYYGKKNIKKRCQNWNFIYNEINKYN